MRARAAVALCCALAVAALAPTAAGASVRPGIASSAHTSLADAPGTSATGLHAVAVDENNDVFYAGPGGSTNERKIHEVSSTGASVRTYTLPAVGSCVSSLAYISADVAAGKMYVADGCTNKVRVYSTSTGLEETSWDVTMPYDIAVQGSTVWVATHDNDKLLSFTTGGVAGLSISSADGTSFNQVSGVGADAWGNVWAADYNNGRVVQFNSAGTYQRKITGISQPYGVDADPAGNVWVVRGGGSSATLFTLAGTSLRTMTGLSNARFADIGGDGRVYVANYNTGTVKTISVPALAVSEGAAATAVDSSVEVGDEDSANLLSARVWISAGFVSGQEKLDFSTTPPDKFDVTRTTDGDITIALDSGQTATPAEFETVLRTVTYQVTGDDPTNATRTISFRLSDSGGEGTPYSRKVTVTPTNDAPSLTPSSGSVNWSEGEAAVAAGSDLVVADPDSSGSTFTGSVAISAGAQTGDGLVYSTTAGVAGTLSGDKRTVTFSTGASSADLQAALRAVRFRNRQDTPTSGSRTLTYSAGDGSGGSANTTRTVAVTGNNAPPQVWTANYSVDTLGWASPGSDRGSAVGVRGMDFGAGHVWASQITSKTARKLTTAGANASGFPIAVDTGNDVAVDSTGAFWVANNTTIAKYSDGGVATGDSAAVDGYGVGVDAAGNVYVATGPGKSVVRYSSTGTNATTVVSGLAEQPRDVAFDSRGYMYVAAATLGGSCPYYTGSAIYKYDADFELVATFTSVLRPRRIVVDSRDLLHVASQDEPDCLTAGTSHVVDTSGRVLASIGGSSYSVMASAVDADRNLYQGDDYGVVKKNMSTLSWTEGNGSLTLDSTLDVGDGDSASLSSATVKLSSGTYRSTEDRLTYAAPSGNPVDGTFDTTTGTLTLTDSAAITKDNLRDALRAVKYENIAGDVPTGGSRTLEIAVNDGAATGATMSRTLTVTAVNDAPVVGGTGTTSYTEQESAKVVAPAVTVSDADNSSLASATVTLTSAKTDDVLSYAKPAGSPVSLDTANSSSSIVKLTGSGTVAEYQAALRAVRFYNGSDRPDTSSRSAQLKVSDGVTESAAATQAITLTAVNDGPTTEPSITTLSYTENDGAKTIDSGVAVSDPDDDNMESGFVKISGGYVAGEDVLSYTRPSGSPVTVSIDGDTASLSGTHSTADYQAALRAIKYTNTSDDPTTGNRAITFNANDGTAGGSSALTLQVASVNDAPTVSTTGTALAYTENDAAAAVDAGVSVADVDDANLESAEVKLTNAKAGDELSYSETAGVSGSVNDAKDAVTLSGSASKASYQAALRAVKYRNGSDDPDASDRTVTFKVNDGAADSRSASRTVDFTAVNDAPAVTATAAALGYTENDAATTVDSGVSVADVDDANLESAEVKLTNAKPGDELSYETTTGVSGSVNDAKDTVTLSGSGTKANYQAALRAVKYGNTSDDPDASDRTVTFKVNDGAVDSRSASRTVDFTAVNDAPTVSTTDAALAYTENDTATAIDSGVSVADVDDANLESAEVKLTNAKPGDELSYSTTSGISGALNDAKDTVTLSGSGSKASYQAALRAVRYRNGSDDPDASDRTVTFRVNDGDADSSSASRSIDFTAVNDAPTVTATTAASGYTENDAATAVDPGVSVADVDDANLESAEVKLTNAKAGDELSYSETAGVTGSVNDAKDTVTLSGSASTANYQAALRAVKYGNGSDDPDATDRTVSFKVNDGDTDSNSASRSVDFTAVNDAPTVTMTTAALGYTENDAATAVDSGVSIADVDDANLESADVKLTNAKPGDELSYETTAGVSGSVNDGKDTVTLDGSGTKAAYQAALRAVKYRNTSDDPDGSDRTVEFKVNDAGAGSNSGSRIVEFTAVNDAPTVAATTAALGYTENDTATVVDSDVTVADLDDANLESAEVKLTNAKPGDELSYTETGGISGTVNDAKDTVTLTGAASKADYQAALRAVKYRNGSDDPDASDRTVTFEVSDGDAVSTAASRTIDFTAVNDAPTVTATTAALGYTENDAATAADPGVSVADVDDANLESAEVKLTNAKPGDELSYETTAGVSGSVNDAKDTVTLRGSGTKAAYEAALRAVKYRNTRNDPSLVDRAVAFSVNDGDATSGAPTRTITLGARPPVNSSAPAISGPRRVGATLTTTEGEWEGTRPMPLAYRWQRCSPAGTGCTDISGAAGSAYVPVAGDVGRRLRVVVTADNPAPGTAEKESQLTAAIRSTIAAPVLAEAPASSSGTNAARFTFTGEEDASFECSVDGAAFSSCTSPVDLTGLSDAEHSFRVRQVYEGVTSAATAHGWTVDTTLPAAPAIIGGPSPETGERSATLEFQVEPGAVGECRLDGAEFAPCVSPVAYTDLALGPHAFEVRQIDAAGNTSAAARHAWRVDVDFEPGDDGANTKKVNGLLGTSVTVERQQIGVGCELNRGSLELCEVDAFVDDADPGAAAASGLRRIGRGRTVLDGRGQRSAVVQVKLNRLGRALMRKHPQGLKAIFKVEAKPFDVDRTFNTTRRAALRPPVLLVLPSAGLFDGDRRRLDPAARRYVRAVADTLRGTKRVRCEGHADGSGTRRYAYRLGKSRARAICRALRKAGLRIPTSSKSYGSARPRASDRSARGRSLNRRVEIRAWF